MLKNTRSLVFSERTTSQLLQKEEESEPTTIKGFFKTHNCTTLRSSPTNRDSGIFEDIVSPSSASGQGNSLEEPDSLLQEKQLPTSDYEYEKDSDQSYDSDRELHASLSSVDTAVVSTSLSISLSSLSTSEDEEVEEKEEFSLSSDSEEDLSAYSGEEYDSSSFGYHSLLNDFTFGGEDNKDFGFAPVQESPSLPNIYDNSHVQQLTSAAADTSCYSDSSTLSSVSRSTSSSSSFNSPRNCCTDSSESSEDDSPSDIEIKMAETKVKMNDSILSSGREELYSRKMKHFKKHKDAIVDVTNCKQTRKETLKQTNNMNISNSYKCQINRDKRQQQEEFPRRKLNLPLSEGEQPSWKDNRYSSSVESPIVDAYEKECQDVPEKMVKELEKETQEKNTVHKDRKENKKGRSEMDIEQDNDLQAFEAAVKAAIRMKEAGSQNNVHIALDLSDDINVRHRPSPQQRRRERNAMRRSLPQTAGSNRDRNKTSSPDIGEFDVYNMETALPKIDWEAIEAHLAATKEEERRVEDEDEKPQETFFNHPCNRRRTDREEIRRKLAMGTDDDFSSDRQLKKPSLQSRLQNGKNLQICFMNETASDCESQCSDTESTQDRIDEIEGNNRVDKCNNIDCDPRDFTSYQAKLQEEAGVALAQAKEMAKMQVKLEKKNRAKSPITEIVRDCFTKVGFPCPQTKRRMSRQILTDMNVAQLQVIVNDFHTEIEKLNEVLVRFLLQRDDLHMEQDSMLVDVEDLSKHLGAKNQCVLLKTDGKPPQLLQRGKKIPSLSTKKLKLKTFVKM